MSLTKMAAAQIAARCEYLEENGHRLVMDGDVHPSARSLLPPEVEQQISEIPNYYHGRPLLAEGVISLLDRAGVDMAMCWQNPAVMRYGDDQDENFERLKLANAAISALAAEHPKRVIPAGWTDPKALGVINAKALARTCVEEFGMPVVKMNPAQNEYPIDDQIVLEVVDEIVALGAVPAFHFGSDSPYTPPSGLELIAKRHPDHPVIGVHMGGGGGHFVEAEPVYQAARSLGLRQPNVFYILSAIRDPHIESALLAYAEAGAPYSGNLVAGSDAPYGDMIWNYGGFRALFAAMQKGSEYGDARLSKKPDLMDGQMVSGFMGGNLARLIVEADRRIMALNGPSAETA